jgi:hypothetical protein
MRTVKDFEELLKSHPLVFRKKKFPREEFAEQFKLAVVDLVRDQYINEYAYKKGYDETLPVKRYAEMWQDNALSLYEKYRYLGEVGQSSFNKENYIKVIEDYLNPYIDSLQLKYSDKIEINIDLFENIELTGIDMVAIWQNVPYPIVSPNFPLITTDHKLDYGNKMK